MSPVPEVESDVPTDRPPKRSSSRSSSHRRSWSRLPNTSSPSSAGPLAPLGGACEEVSPRAPLGGRRPGEEVSADRQGLAEDHAAPWRRGRPSSPPSSGPWAVGVGGSGFTVGVAHRSVEGADSDVILSF